MVIKYEDLTEEQILYCFNGVGSDHFPIDPHDLIFKEPAKKHDACYWIGGDEEDRLRADQLFYKEGLELVKEHFIPLRWFYRIALEVYCLFLFRLGKTAFEYGPKPDTWEELKLRVDLSRKELLKTKRKWRKYGGIVLGVGLLSIPLAIYALAS